MVLSRIVALTAELGEVFADCFNVPEGNGQHGDVMDDWFELF